MLLSRFWYVLTALALGGAAFVLFVAAQLYNRAGSRAMAESLSSDSSAVEWFLKDDARRRSSELIPIALNSDIRATLGKASASAAVARDVREKTRTVLRKAAEDVPAELKFDALWAVDANGRVIGAVGYEHSEDWELGGYGVVADALHGWIRDDAWVWKGRIYRVTARPVEQEVNGEPVGAIIGAKIIDDAFARAVTKRTGAAVGFYADGARVASGSPEGFDAANLDQITQDLKLLDANKDYQEKGRSEVRVIGEHLGVVYARLPGEAWQLGAGYAVGRLAVAVDGPMDFLNKADNGDKAKVPTLYLVLGMAGVALFGLFFSYLEHTRPLSHFRGEVQRLAKGKVDGLQPSRFRGAYKKIAADVNDGIEHVAAKGGGSRRPADLEQVLGPIPAQPAMSAFAMPGDRPSEPRAAPSVPKPAERGAPRLRQATPSAPGTPVPAAAPALDPSAEMFEASQSAPGTPPPRRQAPPPPRRPATPGASSPAVTPLPGPAPTPPSPGAERFATTQTSSAGPTPESTLLDEGSGVAPVPREEAAGDFDELADWRHVYEDFLSVKKQCGEPTSSLSFEKFKGTLQRNKEALVARHGCARVKFTVYVKEGKAALKASPVK